MARSQVTVDVKAKIATYTAKPLSSLPAEALKLADQPTHSGLQTELAIMFYVGQKKSGKAEFNGNKSIFVPFCSKYYGPGKGLQRSELKGFDPSGNHVAKSSAETLLRGYNHFAAAAKIDGDVVPAIRQILEAGGKFATKGIATKGALLTKAIAEAKGKVPSKAILDTLIDKVENPQAGTAPNPVVTAARSLRSRAKELAADSEFTTALVANPALIVQFKEMVEDIVLFAQTAIGQKTGKPGEAEVKTNSELLAAVATIAVPPTTTRRRRGQSA